MMTSQQPKPKQRTLFDILNDQPPFVSGSDTSEAAAESIRGHLGELQRVVYDLIDGAGARGRTCDEIEVDGDLRHQTASARVRELAKRGLIKDLGERRRTRSGRLAAVWVAFRTR